VETWATRASSLQHRELMAQDNVFQQEVTATAKPLSHRRDPSGGPSCHEHQVIQQRPNDQVSRVDGVLRRDRSFLYDAGTWTTLEHPERTWFVHS
jgi:hypothetical protein